MLPTESSAGQTSLPALLRAGRSTYASRVRAALAEHGFGDVPPNGSYLLSGMARAGSALSSLIERLGVSKQTAGQLVDTLVTRGYLERWVDPTDRRRLLVGLTDRGAAAAAAVRAAVESVDAELGDRVGERRLEEARATLCALAEIGEEGG
jgi:DNA-binding MarR family transcriptional regulator